METQRLRTRTPTERDHNTTSTTSTWFTQDYCAPEQLHDFRNATPAVDIYAIGCILHDLVKNTPRIPFQQQTAPGTIGAIIERCTDVNPTKRFKTVVALRSILLTYLADPTPHDPSLDTSNWATALAQLDTWDTERLDAFTHYLRTTLNNDHAFIYARLDDDTLTRLNDIDAERWQALAISYTDWVEHAGFDFAYCDVLIRRLETIFHLGTIDTKARAVLAAASLGSSHNRWYVMRRLLTLCGATLDDRLAQRISIDIVAAEAQDAFLMLCRKNRRQHQRISPVHRTQPPIGHRASAGSRQRGQVLHLYSPRLTSMRTQRGSRGHISPLVARPGGIS